MFGIWFHLLISVMGGEVMCSSWTWSALKYSWACNCDCGWSCIHLNFDLAKMSAQQVLNRLFRRSFLWLRKWFRPDYNGHLWTLCVVGAVLFWELMINIKCSIHAPLELAVGRADCSVSAQGFYQDVWWSLWAGWLYTGNTVVSQHTQSVVFLWAPRDLLCTNTGSGLLLVTILTSAENSNLLLKTVVPALDSTAPLIELPFTTLEYQLTSSCESGLMTL